MPSKQTAKILGHQWRVDSIWNEALVAIPERPLQKRDYIWASELGGSFIDRFLKMNAHPMTNPPNDRSKRKFSAGHIWEWIIGMVLTSTGILKRKQLKTEVQLPGLLKVTGRCDFIAGGDVDWDKAAFQVGEIKKLLDVSISEMPPIVLYSIDRIIAEFKKNFSNKPLEEVILESKSVSSFMSERLQKTGKPMDHHVLQILHYMIPNKLPGNLFYVCKDDCITQQFRVEANRPLLGLYKKDVEQMTGYLNSGTKPYLKRLPPKEKELLFDPEMYRFQTNFRVEYSSYLKYLYNYDTPEAYRNRWTRSAMAWNRVIKRLAQGKSATPSNKKYMDEMDDAFPDWEKYMLKAKKTGFFDEEEGGDDE